MSQVPSGDQVRVSVQVALAPQQAFDVFTAQIDQWWRRGRKFRAGPPGGVLCLEPFVDGRLFERFDAGGGAPSVIETGRVRVWQPPVRLVFEWRSVSFAAGEATEVEVCFDPCRSGTLLTLTHRGWNSIRSDHPVRHGQDLPAFVRSLGLWWGGLLSALRLHALRQ